MFIDCTFEPGAVYDPDGTFLITEDQVLDGFECALSDLFDFDVNGPPLDPNAPTLVDAQTSMLAGINAEDINALSLLPNWLTGWLTKWLGDFLHKYLPSWVPTWAFDYAFKLLANFLLGKGKKRHAHIISNQWCSTKLEDHGHPNTRITLCLNQTYVSNEEGSKTKVKMGLDAK